MPCRFILFGLWTVDKAKEMSEEFILTYDCGCEYEFYTWRSTNPPYSIEKVTLNCGWEGECYFKHCPKHHEEAMSE